MSNNAKMTFLTKTIEQRYLMVISLNDIVKQFLSKNRPVTRYVSELRRIFLDTPTVFFHTLKKESGFLPCVKRIHE